MPIDKANVSCGKVSLRFKPSDRGQSVRSYEIELMKFEGKNLVPVKTWKGETNGELAFDPECKSVYDWRVRATLASGEVTDWSELETFQTGPAGR
jgi:hypothetical protein